MEVVDVAGDAWLVAWPIDAHWDPSQQAVIVGTKLMPLNELLDLGGGERNVTPANVGNYSWSVPPDPSCLPAKVWFTSGFVFQ